jgi:hypothetical protein
VPEPVPTRLPRHLPNQRAVVAVARQAVAANAKQTKCLLNENGGPPGPPLNSLRMFAADYTAKVLSQAAARNGNGAAGMRGLVGVFCMAATPPDDQEFRSSRFRVFRHRFMAASRVGWSSTCRSCATAARSALFASGASARASRGQSSESIVGGPSPSGDE